MRFPYKRYPDKLERPVIPVKIATADRWINYEVLIDSGADICIFDAELAELLGLELKNGEYAAVRGATGELQDVYIHPVEVTVGPHTFGIRVAFMATPGPYGLAGQRGFFSQFRITFDQLEGYVELNTYTE
ncbi:MAG: hypothetical protein NVSMB39_4290 [Candidatus Saccharimonadales bacterium]